MARKTGLGKGINALIPDMPAENKKKNTKTAEKPDKTDEIKIPINKIEPNSDQPRSIFDKESLNELADSIKQYGILQPLIVKKRKDYYEIVAGERRWRAAKLAGLKEVPVIIRDYSENEIVEIALIENIQRENLNPIEEAQAYKRLMEEFSLKQEEVAKKVAKNRTTITNSLRLLKLSEKVQSLVSEELLSMGHARALLAINDEDMQYEVAKKVVDEKLSVREIEALVKKINQPEKPKKSEKSEKNEVEEIIYADIEESLKQIFGSKVNIKEKNQKGKIEIEYYSRDELDRIIDMIKSI